MSERDWESAYLQEITYADGLERRALAAERDLAARDRLIERLVEVLPIACEDCADPTCERIRAVLAEARALKQEDT